MLAPLVIGVPNRHPADGHGYRTSCNDVQASTWRHTRSPAILSQVPPCHKPLLLLLLPTLPTNDGSRPTPGRCWRASGSGAAPPTPLLYGKATTGCTAQLVLLWMGDWQLLPPLPCSTGCCLPTYPPAAVAGSGKGAAPPPATTRGRGSTREWGVAG
jgi:hypothetical protein